MAPVLNKFVWLSVLFFAAACAVSPLEAENNLYSVEGWPGEGIPTFSAQKDYLIVYREPSLQSESAKVSVEKGAALNYKRSRMVTLKSVKFVAETTLQTWCGPSYSDQGTVPEGTPLEYLSYRSEGDGRFLIGDKVCLISLNDLPSIANSEAQPEVQWWVELKRPPPSWVIVTDDGLVKRGKRVY